jgi:phosphoglycolate phosphatase
VIDRFEVIVFDWDGTLFDSTCAITESIRLAALDLGLADPGPERAAHVIGLGLKDAIAHAVPDLAPERLVDYIERYRVHFLGREGELRLFEPARQLIDEARARGCRLAIATGKSRVGLQRALRSLELEHHFEATRCADESEPKPSPRMLLELADVMNASTQRMLMVGDTTHDLLMARAAGVAAVALSHGAHSAAQLSALAPLRVFDSLAGFHRWLIPH